MRNFFEGVRTLGAVYAFFSCWFDTGEIRFGVGAYHLIQECLCFPWEFRRPIERGLRWETRVLLRWMDDLPAIHHAGRVWIPLR